MNTPPGHNQFQNMRRAEKFREVWFTDVVCGQENDKESNTTKI